jgi:hypothetical protein
MQKVMRRTLGVGGATAAAMAATLALAGAASACTWTADASAGCDKGVPTVTIDLQDYSTTATNKVTVTGENGQALQGKVIGKHGSSTVQLDNYVFKGGYFQATASAPEANAGANVYTFTVKVTTSDNHATTQEVKTEDSKHKPTACSPSTTTTTTTVPPTTTESTPPTTTGGSAPTTTAAAVAPVSDKTATPPGGLAYTGVSTELPLIIAGVLIVLGAGALITMRVLKRRRAES